MIAKFPLLARWNNQIQMESPIHVLLKPGSSFLSCGTFRVDGVSEKSMPRRPWILAFSLGGILKTSNLTKLKEVEINQPETLAGGVTTDGKQKVRVGDFRSDIQAWFFNADLAYPLSAKLAGRIFGRFQFDDLKEYSLGVDFYYTKGDITKRKFGLIIELADLQKTESVWKNSKIYFTTNLLELLNINL